MEVKEKTKDETKEKMKENIEERNAMDVLDIEDTIKDKENEEIFINKILDKQRFEIWKLDRYRMLGILSASNSCFGTEQ